MVETVSVEKGRKEAGLRTKEMEGPRNCGSLKSWELEE